MKLKTIRAGQRIPVKVHLARNTYWTDKMDK